jgi:hypothetical protein
VTDSIREFELDRQVFVDEKSAYERSGKPEQSRLVRAINVSSSSSRLWIIGAGPMMSIYASLRAADVRSIRYVTLVSHSDSNNKHAEAHSPGVKWKTIQAFVLGHGGSVHCGAGSCVGATVRKPRDQNKGLDFRSPKWKTGGKPRNEVWKWLEDSSDSRLSFVYDRIVDSNVADVSDAGMVYYIVTGDENASPDKLRRYMSRDEPTETLSVGSS